MGIFSSFPHSFLVKYGNAAFWYVYSDSLVILPFQIRFDAFQSDHPNVTANMATVDVHVITGKMQTEWTDHRDSLSFFTIRVPLGTGIHHDSTFFQAYPHTPLATPQVQHAQSDPSKPFLKADIGLQSSLWQYGHFNTRIPSLFLPIGSLRGLYANHPIPHTKPHSLHQLSL